MAQVTITSFEESSSQSWIDPVKAWSNEEPLSSKFALLRQLVPVVAEGSVTHLNAGFMPPSNLVVHGAIERFCAQWLHNASPKPGWKRAVEEARELVAKYINTDSSCIAFVRDTTEAMGYFIHSVRLQPGDNVVILDCEHPNQAYGWLSLRPLGIEVRQVPTGSEADGFAVAANADTFAKYVDERTRVIGISSVMFHSGQLNDVANICATYRPRGIHVLADLTQQVGFSDVDVQSLGVSAAAFSLHKGLNCPLGFAAMYVSEDFIQELDPIPPIVGYGAVRHMDEGFMIPDGPIDFHKSARRYEHANTNLLAAYAAVASLKLYLNIIGPKEVEEHLYGLGDALRERCDELGVVVAGSRDRKLHAPHLYILKLYGDEWVYHFQKNKVELTVFWWGVRVSFGFYSSLDDVKRLGAVIRSGIDAGLCV